VGSLRQDDIDIPRLIRHRGPGGSADDAEYLENFWPE